MTPRPIGEKERIATRRRFVMKERVAGKTIDEIHEAWNASQADNPDWQVSRATIGNDLKETLRLLIEETKLDTASAREMLIMRIDGVLSTEKFQDALKRGSLPAIDRFDRLMDKYAKLYGAYAPTKVAQTDITGEKDVAQMTEDERAQRVQELLARARERQMASDEDDAFQDGQE